MQLKKEIETLLQTKSYERLNIAEKDLVRQYFNRTDYNRLHEVFKTNEQFRKESPEISRKTSDQIYSYTSARLKSRRARSMQFINSEMTLWQTALLMSIVAVICWNLGRNTALTSTQEVKTEYKIDTVYIEIPVEIPVLQDSMVLKPKENKKLPIAKNDIPKVEKEMTKKKLDLEKRLELEAESIVSIMPIARVEKKKWKGRNAKEEAKLLEVLVKVY